MNEVFKGFEPQSFFYWFDEISRIPRGSKTEQAIGDYIMGFAAKRGLSAERDVLGSILVRVPASKGYENEPVLLLQAHLDMVWATAPGVSHDFTKDPIGYRIENGGLYGNGTNLGSDNGIGIAFMLAIADGNEFVHPELELLFTVQEEIGLIGMKNFDMTKLRARRMINTDCGKSHMVCVSSVGCKINSVNEQMPVTDSEGLTGIRVVITGGLGGHGGLDAHRNRMDAASLMGELLSQLDRSLGVRLASIEMEGGYIHRGGTAALACPTENVQTAAIALRGFAKESLTRYFENDPGVTVTIETVGAECLKPVSEADTQRIIRLLLLIPSGALRHDALDLEYVITSSGTTKASLTEGAFSVTYSTRSAIDIERDLWDRRFSEICRLLGFEPVFNRGYGGWPERKDSVLQKKIRACHERLFGNEIAVEHIHGGIEASYVIMAHPDMDIIGISPTAFGAHTLNEHIVLSEVGDFWTLMKAFLAERDAK